jgi:hypothetical protein
MLEMLKAWSCTPPALLKISDADKADDPEYAHVL